MKNIKKTIASGIILSALTFGANFANAGIVIAKSKAESCTTTGGSKTIFDRIGGIILEGIVIAKTGIVIAKEGIVIAKEASAPCESSKTREGIVIA